MIGLAISTNAKLAVIWILLKWYYVVDLISDSIWIILFCYCKFCTFKTFLHCVIFIFFFIPNVNKRNILNNIIDISSFQNELNDVFSSIGFYLRSKIIESSHKGEDMLSYESLDFLSKCWWFWMFFLSSDYPINSVFQWQ